MIAKPIDKENLLEDFLKYVVVDTEADPDSDTVPSSEKQKILSRMLHDQLLSIGLKDVELTKHGYVYATIPANGNEDAPTICFCSHVDTTADCSGANVKPIVNRNYQGQTLVLPDDTSQELSPENHDYLNTCLGHTIITASGTTLLGSDDKSGVAIIMQLAKYLLANPDIKHGKIRILYTTDEEIGRGVDHVNLDKLGAHFGYTLDGGIAGSYEDETFSADMVTLTVKGKAIHPAMAKDVMENGIKIAAEIIANLPKDRLSPETTEGREGFIHPLQVISSMGSAELKFLIRDFDTSKLADHEDLLRKIADEVMKSYTQSSYTFEVIEQYRNMYDVNKNFPQLTAHVEEAIRRTGLKVFKEAIRGGTDGSKLSHMGLPCPNIYTGMQAIHSRQEWVSLEVMAQSVETLVHLAQIWEQQKIGA